MSKEYESFMMNWRTRSKPGFGPRLVAELGLNLVPDLRQLLVAAQLAARDGRHHLFVRHAQAEIAPEAVLQAEHVVAHDVPAARFLPDFGRIQRRQQHLLAADGVHLLAHDLLNLQQRALRQETGNCRCPRTAGGCSRRAEVTDG